MFKYFISLIMIIVFGSTSFISVQALVSFLPDAGFIIFIMGIGIEAGKLCIIIFIHRSWTETNFFIRTCYCLLAGFLITLTACEVTGYLSFNHKLSAQNRNILTTELTGLQSEKEFLKQQIILIKRNMQDFKKGWGTKRLEVRKESNYNSMIERMSEIIKRETELSKNIITGSEQAGPVFSIAEIYGINHQKSAKYFIMILVIVLEILSTGLIIATSHLWFITVQNDKKTNFAENTASAEPAVFVGSNIEKQSHIETKIASNKKFIATGNNQIDFLHLVELYNLSAEKIAEITERKKIITVSKWLANTSDIPEKAFTQLKNKLLIKPVFEERECIVRT